jgi:hypothetical protein
MTLYNEEREGQSPKVTGAGGGSVVVDWSQEPNGMQRASNILGTILTTIEQEESNKQKKIKEKFDTYKVLREAGYDSKAAFEAIQSGNAPGAAPDTSVADSKASADLAKTRAETEKISAEAESLKEDAPEIVDPTQPFVKVQGKVRTNPAYVNPKKGSLQEFNATTKARQEFLNREEVKDYITTSTNVKAMEGLLAAAKSGDVQNKVALDQGLITMYNKLTDPASVVRESEYARTGANLPTVNRIVGAIEKVAAGGAGLTDSDREALVLGAKIIMKERGKTYNSTLGEYKNLASEYGFKEDLVTRGMQPYALEFNSEEEAMEANLPPGTTVSINGRKAVIEGDEEE